MRTFDQLQRRTARLRAALLRAETDLFLAALTATNGNRTRAAAMLGVHVRTIHRWIDEHPEAPAAPPNIPPQLRE